MAHTGSVSDPTCCVPEPTSAILIAPGETEQLTTRLVLADGARVDVTARATWTSSKPEALTVSPTGLVTGRGHGVGEVTATFDGGFPDTSDFTVLGAPVAPR